MMDWFVVFQGLFLFAQVAVALRFIRRLSKAEDTLLCHGFRDKGGTLWKTPIGPSPFDPEVGFLYWKDKCSELERENAMLIKRVGQDRICIKRMIRQRRELKKSLREFSAALEYLLQQTVDSDLAHGITLTEGEAEARQMAIDAIANAGAVI